MKSFTPEVHEVLTMLASMDPLTAKQETIVRLLEQEMEVTIEGFCALSDFHRHQQKRWNDEAEALCLYRTLIRGAKEKRKETPHEI